MWHPDESRQLPSVQLTDLSLEQLRTYRDALRHEADRVSYWRRVVHGRVDLISAQRQSASELTREQLSRALADTGSGRMRAGLMRIEAAEPLPDLPALDEVWRDVDTADEGAVRDYLGQLAAVEKQLNAYRDALHARVDEATAELIRRYREQPRLALRLLTKKGVPVGG